jgi:hypothetical protein
MTRHRHRSRLRYVDATRIDRQPLAFDRLDVRDRAGHRLGRLDGLVVDPRTRRVRFLVISSPGWLGSHRYLVPLREAQVDRERQSLAVDVAAEAFKQHRTSFDPDTIPSLSDADMVAA